jgi:ankyrin repeat protein
MVHLLLERNAHIDAADAGGLTALHHAVRADQPRMCRLLLSRGANKDLAVEPSPISAAMLAKMDGRTACLRTLLGTDIHSGADVRGATEYALAIERHAVLSRPPDAAPRSPLPTRTNFASPQ